MNDKRLQYNEDVQLVDAISASALSAAVYFGRLSAKNVIWDRWEPNGTTQKMRGAVFHDGGQGTQNNTLGLTTLQAIMRDWGNRLSKNDQGVIISLGCGSSFPKRTYNSASQLDAAWQLLAFLGNESRSESSLLQWRAASMIAAQNPNFQIFRFDYQQDKLSSAFSAKMHKNYEQAARELADRPDFKWLADDLCKVPLAPIDPTPEETYKPKTNKINALQAL